MPNKPKLKYVDMCKYIDEHIYEPDHDCEKIFHYIEKLFYALAFKKNYFTKKEDYIEYSFYGASHVYSRMINPRQYLDINDPKYLPKIKSVLNFIKAILYPLKVDYQKANFCRLYKDDIHGEGVINYINKNLTKNAKSNIDGFISVDTELYLNNLPNIINTVIKDTPYSNNKLISEKLFISCSLTLLNNITLSNKDLDKLNKPKKNLDEYINEIYKENNKVINWHLKPDFNNYIQVLCNRIKSMIATDIKDIINYYEPGEEIIKNILATPILDELKGD